MEREFVQCDNLVGYFPIFRKGQVTMSIREMRKKLGVETNNYVDLKNRGEYFGDGKTRVDWFLRNVDTGDRVALWDYKYYDLWDLSGDELDRVISFSVFYDNIDDVKFLFGGCDI